MKRSGFSALAGVLCAVAAAALLSGCGKMAPDGKSADKLREAWKEYQYRDFDKAWDLFSAAERLASTKEDSLQAMTGKAFCLQFGKRALVSVSDYESAIDIYKDCLEKVKGDSKFEPFFKSMAAECEYGIYRLNGDESRLKSAMETWDWLQKNFYGSLVAQDALLFKTVSLTDSFKDPKAVERAVDVEEYLNGVKALGEAKASSKSAERLLLSPVMANYLATLYFWRGDYKDSVKWLKTYIDFGPTSYAAKTNSFFKVARISELKLGDSKTAAQYYSAFYMNFPSDRRAYFAMTKSRSLLEESQPKEGK